MPEPVRLKDTLNRPMQSWLMNGTDDLMFGLMLFVYGSLDGAGILLSKDSSIAGYVPPLKLALMALFVIALSKGVRGLRERIIHPRAGYMVLREPPLRSVVFSMATTVVIVFLSAFFLTIESLSPALALFFAGGYLVEGIRRKVPHMVGFAIFAFLLAGWASRTRAGSAERFFWVTIGLGGALMVSGGIRLVKFLRANPLPGESQEQITL